MARTRRLIDTFQDYAYVASVNECTWSQSKAEFWGGSPFTGALQPISLDYLLSSLCLSFESSLTHHPLPVFASLATIRRVSPDLTMRFSLQCAAVTALAILLSPARGETKFSKPGPVGQAGFYRNNPSYTIGEEMKIEWTSDLESMDLVLWIEYPKPEADGASRETLQGKQPPPFLH